MSKTQPITVSDAKMSVKHHVGSVEHNLSHGKDHFTKGVIPRLQGLQKVAPKVAIEQAKKAVGASEAVKKKLMPFTAAIPSAKGACK